VFGNALDGQNAARFWDSAELLEAIRREIGTPSDGEAVDAAVKCPGLLLDDLGSERNSDFARDKLGLILRARYNRQHATIITTNSTSLSELASIDPRIGSRVSEGIVVPLVGRDMGQRPR
jgi:DNA replication protein DnaC